MSRDDGNHRKRPRAKPKTVADVTKLPHGMSATAVTFASWTAMVDKPPDDHPVYKSIGRVASEWSHYEHALDNCIWTMLGTSDARGGCVTGQMMGHAPRLNAIIALATHLKLSKELIEKAKSLMGASYEAANERNRIVHDTWFLVPGSDKPDQFRSMAPKDLRFGLVDIPDDALETTIAKIRRRYEDAMELLFDIAFELEPWKEKQL